MVVFYHGSDGTYAISIKYEYRFIHLDRKALDRHKPTVQATVELLQIPAAIGDALASKPYYVITR